MNNMKIRPGFVALIGSVIATAAAMLAFAGPLDPPPGPVASTFKTLSDVEPRIAINSTNTPGDGATVYRISQPGSYYLTGNLAGEANKHGIIVAVSNVTIDLNGFRVSGDAASWDGIINGTNVNAVTVRNGTVSGWNNGVNLGNVSAGEGCEVHSVNARGNRLTGVKLGLIGRATNVTAVQNGSEGFVVGDGAIIESCAARLNSGLGIVGGSHVRIEDTSVLSCVAGGISVGDAANITDCVISLNGGTGVAAGSGTSVSGCTARQNNGAGFLLGSVSTVTGSTAVRCTGDGFQVGSGSSVSDSSSRENTVAGFFINAGTTISRCSAQLNQSHGIEGSADNLILSNACDSNGATGTGSGIEVFSDGNRIEGNNCTDNDVGIQVNGTKSIILRNTCSNNTLNFDLAAGNRFGPIVDLTAGGTPAASGNAAPGTLLTDEANANFAY
ncbi:MAG: hypothetical protein GIKADHBN_03505 [Phycisphaerales bacterium]|nr:hypothetical protein [Phycisphaerales bacterium]